MPKWNCKEISVCLQIVSLQVTLPYDLEEESFKILVKILYLSLSLTLSLARTEITWMQNTIAQFSSIFGASPNCPVSCLVFTYNFPHHLDVNLYCSCLHKRRESHLHFPLHFSRIHAMGCVLESRSCSWNWKKSDHIQSVFCLRNPEPVIFKTLLIWLENKNL